MLRGAIFDMDGTLLDSMFLWDYAGEWFLESVGIKADPDLASALATFTLEEGAEYMKNVYHLSMSQKEIVEGVNDIIRDFYYNKVQCKEGVRQFLEYLKRRQVKMVIATATEKSLAKEALKRNEIFSYFSDIITCSEVGAGKKQPDIFHMAREKIGTKIAETWVFEDALHAVKTAKEAGYPVCGIYDASSQADKEMIQKLSDVFLYDFGEWEQFFKVSGECG